MHLTRFRGVERNILTKELKCGVDKNESLLKGLEVVVGDSEFLGVIVEEL